MTAPGLDLGDGRTIFDKTRTPLTVWFHACWLFATAKDGISAQYLQRALEIGSYQTAWAMLHRLRSALVRPGRGRGPAGTVEVDETFIRREEQGLRGGRQPGKKVLTGIAVEIGEPKAIGGCRMAVLADPAVPAPRSARSWPAASSRAAASSPTAGSAITAWPPWATPTSGATRRPRPAAATGPR